MGRGLVVLVQERQEGQEGQEQVDTVAGVGAGRAGMRFRLWVWVEDPGTRAGGWGRGREQWWTWPDHMAAALQAGISALSVFLQAFRAPYLTRFWHSHAVLPLRAGLIASIILLGYGLVSAGSWAAAGRG